MRVYSSAFNGDISYYHDRYGLEADAVLHLDDGRYALIEFKLGSDEIDLGATHLCEIERLIGEYNKKGKEILVHYGCQTSNLLSQAQSTDIVGMMACL